MSALAPASFFMLSRSRSRSLVTARSLPSPSPADAALAALVAERLGVDLALLLTTVPGLLDNAGRLLPTVERVTPEIRALANDTVDRPGLGGMASKLEAAGQMTAAGIDVVVGDGRRALQDLVTNAAPRTLFVGNRHGQRSAS